MKRITFPGYEVKPLAASRSTKSSRRCPERFTQVHVQRLWAQRFGRTAERIQTTARQLKLKRTNLWLAGLSGHHRSDVVLRGVLGSEHLITPLITVRIDR